MRYICNRIRKDNDDGIEIWRLSKHSTRKFSGSSFSRPQSTIYIQDSSSSRFNNTPNMGPYCSVLQTPGYTGHTILALERTAA